MKLGIYNKYKSNIIAYALAGLFVLVLNCFISYKNESTIRANINDIHYDRKN